MELASTAAAGILLVLLDVFAGHPGILAVPVRYTVGAAYHLLILSGTTGVIFIVALALVALGIGPVDRDQGIGDLIDEADSQLGVGRVVEPMVGGGTAPPSMAVVSLRLLGFATGAVVGVATLVLLPLSMSFDLLALLLAALAGAAAVTVLALRQYVLADVALGVGVVAAAPVAPLAEDAIRSLPLLPATGAPAADSTLSTYAVVLVIVGVWTPLAAVVAARTWRRVVRWELGLPLAMALLLVGANALAIHATMPDAEVTIDAPDEVDVTAHQPVPLAGSDYIVDNRLVTVGVLRLENPADHSQPVDLPNVAACLYTPERHDLSVRQGTRDESGWHYPADPLVRLAPGETKTVTLRLDLGPVDGSGAGRDPTIANATLQEVGTVPITVADSCPERSAEPRLVLHTTSNYDPRGSWD